MRLDTEIDRLCDEFKQSWKSGAAPEIVGFVERISATARLALLGQLVPVDLEYRLQRGEIPKADDYAQAGVEAVEVAERELKKLEASGRLVPKVISPIGSAADMEAATLPPVKVNNSVDEFATVIPVHKDADATVVPAVDVDATLLPIREAQSTTAGVARVRYFGDYELLSEIARGGMGVVYKARQVNLNRVVALKMILAGNLASDEDVQRFRTEAEAAANLDHPGIVPIYEIGQHEGQHFFSMGYVDGCSLADRVRNGPLPPKEAAELTKKIAESIAFAHSRNVIHRDLKPANVLLDQNGEPKVTDFGLARKTDTDSGMTRTGAVMGTPSYMPPEQAAGKTAEVGPLSDVYSLGAILYCLLTGRPPFQAANPMDTLLQVMEREPVSVSTINPAIQRDLETICHKCLQKEPAKRYSSALELADDLGRWLRGEPIQARAVSNAERVYRWVKRNQLVSGLTAATALALLIGAVVSILFGIAAENEATKARIAEKTAIASQENAEATLARSNYFLAVARWDQNRPQEARDLLEKIPDEYRHLEWHLARNEFEGSEMTVPVTDSVNNLSMLKFSANGKWLVAAMSSDDLLVLDASNGKEFRRFKREFGSFDGSTPGVWGTGTFDISPDSRLIVQSIEKSNPNTELGDFGFIDGVRIWEIETGQLRKEIEFGPSRIQSVAFSADMKKIIAGVGSSVMIDGHSEKSCIGIWDIHTGQQLRSFEDVKPNTQHVQFSPDAKEILYSDDNETGIRDSESGRLLMTLNGVAPMISPDSNRIITCTPDVFVYDRTIGQLQRTIKVPLDSASCMTISGDGRLLATGGSDGIVRLWDFATGTLIQARKGHSDAIRSVAFSSDGSRLASGSDDKTLRFWDVPSIDDVRSMDGAVNIRGAICAVHAVSFNRQQLCVCTSDGLLIVDPTTGDELKRLGPLPTGLHLWAIEDLRFSRDGKYVAGIGGGNLLLDDVSAGWLSVWDASTGQQLFTLARNVELGSNLDFSPKGDLIISGGLHGDVRVWSLQNGQSSQSLQLFEDGFVEARFSPDGAMIATSGKGQLQKSLKMTNFTTGKTVWETDDGGCLCFSPDGRVLAAGSKFSGQGQIYVHDALTGAVFRTLHGHTEQVENLSFSEDGKRLLSVGGDKAVKLWDVTTGEEVLQFTPSSGENVSRPKALFAGNAAWITVAWSDRDFIVLGIPRSPNTRTPFRWHEDQRLLAESESSYFAAAFHSVSLLRLSPNDAWLHDSFAEAYSKLREAHGDNVTPLPPLILQALQLPRGNDFPRLTEESAVTINTKTWGLVGKPTVDSSSPLSQGQLQQMRDVCGKFPLAAYLTTLGVAEYRDGRNDAAIQTLNQAAESFSAEMKLTGPSPFYLAFLAMAHHKLGHTEEATRYREQMLATIKEPRYQFDASAKCAVAEALHVFDGSDLWKEVSTTAEFEQEATFEDIMVNHWQVTTWKNRPEQISLSTDVTHEGTAALKMQITEDADDVSLYQPVSVEPNQQYRLTAWVKTEDVAVGPEQSGTTGACLTIFDHDVSAESVLGASDWKQITWEFNSGDASVLSIGCRLGSHGSACTGTAWFDDVKLEKVE